jgi:hypothetical protein
MPSETRCFSAPRSPGHLTMSPPPTSPWTFGRQGGPPPPPHLGPWAGNEVGGGGPWQGTLARYLPEVPPAHLKGPLLRDRRGTNSSLEGPMARGPTRGECGGKHFHLNSAQTAQDPSRPEAEVPGLKSGGNLARLERRPSPGPVRATVVQSEARSNLPAVSRCAAPSAHSGAGSWPSARCS